MQNGFGSPTFFIQTARKIKTSDDAIEFIKQLEQIDRESIKHIVLDCPAKIAKEIIFKHVQTVMLGIFFFKEKKGDIINSKFLLENMFFDLTCASSI